MSKQSNLPLNPIPQTTLIHCQVNPKNKISTVHLGSNTAAPNIATAPVVEKSGQRDEPTSAREGAAMNDAPSVDHAAKPANANMKRRREVNISDDDFEVLDAPHHKATRLKRAHEQMLVKTRT